MHRETENLRTLAGETGPGDLETLLKAAASAWGGQPVQTLQYEPGRLTLVGLGLECRRRSSNSAPTCSPQAGT